VGDSLKESPTIALLRKYQIINLDIILKPILKELKHMKYTLPISLLIFLFLLKFQNPSFAQNVEVDGIIQLKAGAKEGYILQSDEIGIGTWVPSETITRKQLFVTDFGAIGDGIADDTEPFQEAIDSAAIQGGTVQVPVGNYRITQTLKVPAGVKLNGAGLGTKSGAVKGSRISFYGNTIFALEYTGDYVGCSNMAIVDAGGQALGGINYKASSGVSGIGATFQDVLLQDFTNGTSLQLIANSGSGIAWSSFENIHIQNAKKGIYISVENDGSFINLVSFRSIAISGSGFDYGILVEGPLSSTDWYSVALNIDCPTVGQVVLDTKGYVNMYGTHIVTADTQCADTSTLIELKADTRGSYIHGSAGRGRIIDKGSNYIDLQGESDTGIRPTGNNELLNSAFKGVTGTEIPYWKYETCSNCTTPDAVEVLASEWKDQHQVLKLTIGAGKLVHFNQQEYYLTKSFNQKECLLGAMIKTDAPNMRVASYLQTCGSGNSTSSSSHPNDGQWHYIGQAAELDIDANCLPDPRFIFDNSAGKSEAIVYITTPSFVFNRGEKPTLESGTITAAGGILNGTLSTSMLAVASPTDNSLELPYDANIFQISGTESITSINLNSAIFPKGTLLTLLFEESGLQVTHNAASISLLGTADYISEIYSSLKLVSLGDGTWLEVDRNCLNGCVAANTIQEESTQAETIAERSTPQSELILVQPKELAITKEIPVRIYPNPTLYGVHIDFDGPTLPQAHQLKLMDNSGKIIYEQPVALTKTWIDFSGLAVAAGTYLLQIYQDDAIIITKKIVVIKE